MLLKSFFVIVNFHAGDEDAVGCLFGVHVAAALRIVAELISRRIGLPVSLRAAGVSGGVSAELQDVFDFSYYGIKTKIQPTYKPLDEETQKWLILSTAKRMKKEVLAAYDDLLAEKSKEHAGDALI